MNRNFRYFFLTVLLIISLVGCVRSFMPTFQVSRKDNNRSIVFAYFEQYKWFWVVAQKGETPLPVYTTTKAGALIPCKMCDSFHDSPRGLKGVYRRGADTVNNVYYKHPGMMSQDRKTSFIFQGPWKTELPFWADPSDPIVQWVPHPFFVVNVPPGTFQVTRLDLEGVYEYGTRTTTTITTYINLNKPLKVNISSPGVYYLGAYRIENPREYKETVINGKPALVKNKTPREKKRINIKRLNYPTEKMILGAFLGEAKDTPWEGMIRKRLSELD